MNTSPQSKSAKWLALKTWKNVLPALMAVGLVACAGMARAAYQSEIVVSVKDFGAVGNGVTDDSAAIQQALVYAFANKKDVYFPSATYAVGTTIIIPQYMDYTMRGIKVDGGNSTFKLLSNIPLFTSGYMNGTTLTSNFGTSDDFRYSMGITLENFSVKWLGTSALTEPALKIQDWHQGCAIRNVSSSVHEVFLHSHNNYYLLLDDVRTMYETKTSGPRFVFSGQHNLNKFTRLVAVNSEVGYKFSGPVTAVHFTSNSVEGVDVGLLFESSVYDIAVENCYMEGFSNVAVKFSDYVISAVFRNNYVNFLNETDRYFVEYSPSPLNNILIEADNTFQSMPGVKHIIKNLDTMYSRGVVIRRPKVASSDIRDLLVDNTKISPNLEWEQKVDMTGMKANVVNEYAVGNYAGRFTSGHNRAHGFEWINTGNTNLRLKTRIVPSSSQRIYVNIYVYGAGWSIAGEFVGSDFFEYGSTGLKKSTKLSVSTVGGYVEINGTMPSAVNECFGEVRLL